MQYPLTQVFRRSVALTTAAVRVLAANPARLFLHFAPQTTPMAGGIIVGPYSANIADGAFTLPLVDPYILERYKAYDMVTADWYAAMIAGAGNISVIEVVGVESVQPIRCDNEPANQQRERNGNGRYRRFDIQRRSAANVINPNGYRRLFLPFRR